MKHRTLVTSVAALASSVAVCTAQAASIDIDLTGWVTVGFFADPGNSEVLLDIGAGSLVTGFEFINLSFESLGESWQSEFTLSVNSSDGWQWMDFWPSTVEEPGVFGPASGSWSPPPAGDGAPFKVDDGILWVTIYESLADVDGDGNPIVNAQVLQGSLRVIYQPIPEPATYAMMAFGLLGVGAVARRRLGGKADR